MGKKTAETNRIIEGVTILLNTSTNCTYIASKLDEQVQTGTRENDQHIEWAGELNVPVVSMDKYKSSLQYGMEQDDKIRTLNRTIVNLEIEKTKFTTPSEVVDGSLEERAENYITHLGYGMESTFDLADVKDFIIQFSKQNQPKQAVVSEDKILEIIQGNYNKFKGTNEAEIHSAKDIVELLNLSPTGTNESVDELVDFIQENIGRLIPEQFNKALELIEKFKFKSKND